MANFKRKERYFIGYNNKQRFEVSEDIYRVWSYYTNKEVLAAKLYHSHAKYNEKGVLISVPSRMVSIFEEVIERHLAADNDDPQVVFEQEQQLDCLYIALSTLPYEYQEIIRLLFFEHFTECEIAKHLGVCQATISNRKRKALTLLREYFMCKGITYADFANI